MAVDLSKLAKRLAERVTILVWPDGLWSIFRGARPETFDSWMFEVHPDLPGDAIDAMIAESMEEEPPELLPCPFCGGAARVEEANKSHRVECTGCWAATDWNNERTVVVGAWNRRHA